MFKKKPNIKPLSPLRSSDRRKLADQIIEDFTLHVPTQPNNGDNGAPPDGHNPSTAGLSVLRNSLLPENALSARFTTTAGPDQKLISGTVFVGSHPGQEQRILWVKEDQRIYPTVYTLWNNPDLLPLLHTPSVVMQKLKGGADLMIPGLAFGPPFPAAATKGSIVAVAQIENPTVPLFVGICEVEVAKLSVVQGEKGRAVRGLHWEADELWAWSSTGKPGSNPPERIEGWAKHHDVVDGLDKNLEQLTTQEDEDGVGGGVSLKAPGNHSSSPQGHNEFVEGEDVGLFERVDEDDRELSTKGIDARAKPPTRNDRLISLEIDSAFRRAFLYGLHHHSTSNKNEANYGLSFPLSSSFVMSNLVLPFLPTFTASQTNSLQIKKTSWKNAKKFIKSLDKERLIRTKERNGGEVVVLDADFQASALRDFVPYKLPKKEQDRGDGLGAPAQNSSTGASDDQSVGQRLKRVNLYRPKEKLSPIFSAAKMSAKSVYLAPEIRSITTAYIESESLISSTNKSLIKLDPILANAVFDSGSKLDQEVIAKGTVPRDTLFERVVSSCSPFWAILRDAETKHDAKPKAGKAPQIQILLETRSGNKTVTKLSGLEAYQINPQPLAEELQKACASSTSVNQLVGSSPKNPVMEIMVQGPQTQAVVKALEKRGVQRQWIDVVDKTKGKKR
ncbi:MAG: hypothetical protein M1837_004600 [Sclerophora amabilis]|nr:MAG: hypothetical protein M1837_004600 [Sclerophora amabilis]